MKLADRLKNLGTETAFAVSGEARAWSDKGNKVYPFHLGDINIRTPENIIVAAEKAMRDGFTGYCPNVGIPKLREVLAEDVAKSHGMELGAENIAIQPGGKPVIGKFIMAVMNPGDEVLYPNPGYPIYESQIEFHGGTAVPYGYKEGAENFEIDLEEIKSKITPATKILIVNDLQNPTGAEASKEELQALADIAIENNLTVLSDEAYYDMRYAGSSNSIANLPGMQERTVMLYTFSKKFAMTGWRLGAAIGPKEVIAEIGKLNVNDESCSNHFVQVAAIEALTGDQSGVQEISKVLKERRDMAVDILNESKGVKCFRPNATFYLFANVTEAMQNKNLSDYDEFRVAALQATGVSFCTRGHFGRVLPGEENKYIRFAYSGIDAEQIAEGLTKFKNWLEA